MRGKLLTIVIGTAIILGAGVWAGAHAAEKASAGKHTGCLAKGDAPNEFKLTNVDGGSTEYELIGGKDLKDHVGHKVEVTGEALSAKLAAKAEKGEAKEAGESSHQHLRVSSMRHIAATCP